MKDQTNGRLAEMFRHAAENGLHENITGVMARLARHEESGNEVVLTPDFAPLSLNFAVMDNNNQCLLHGGVIYHGTHDGGGNGSSPTFSVNLQLQTGWAIHT